jgi:hypothetical protein
MYPVSDEEITFTANISAGLEEIAEAVFDALTAAAWADHRSMVRLEMVRMGVGDSKAVLLETRLQFAKEAFDMVIGRLAPASPFRTVLQRYADETVPAVLRRGTPPPRPALKLVP